jgi:phosphoserine phosphatase
MADRSRNDPRTESPDTQLRRLPLRRAAERYGSVVFDCDSTLSAIEGIDELAGSRRAEIERLTQSAMLGEIPLEAVYGRRLDRIRPTRAQVEALGQRYIAALVPDAHAVIAALRSEGVAVRVMSGGLLPAVVTLAAHLGISAADVGAVDIYFDRAGAFTGFDEASPLARGRGKLDLMSAWRRELPRPIMFVGDGATDLEAAPAADLFVAFAGIGDRPAVTAAADVVVRAHSLAPILALALGDAEPVDADARALWTRGRSLLQMPDSFPSLMRDQTHR